MGGSESDSWHQNFEKPDASRFLPNRFFRSTSCPTSCFPFPPVQLSDVLSYTAYRSPLLFSFLASFSCSASGVRFLSAFWRPFRFQLPGFSAFWCPLPIEPPGVRFFSAFWRPLPVRPPWIRFFSALSGARFLFSLLAPHSVQSFASLFDRKLFWN
jgi:hypothetical protein